MDLETQIEIAGEKLSTACRDLLALVGKDVAMALLIHELHEISLTSEKDSHPAKAS